MVGMATFFGHALSACASWEKNGLCQRQLELGRFLLWGFILLSLNENLNYIAE